MPPEGVDHRRVMGLAMRIHSGDDMHVRACQDNCVNLG
jgi:hypothetical protein